MENKIEEITAEEVLLKNLKSSNILNPTIVSPCIIKAMEEYANLKIKGYKTALEDKDKDMIGFAFWLKHNCNCFDSSPHFYYLEDNEPKTETELLHLYKNLKG